MVNDGKLRIIINLSDELIKQDGIYILINEYSPALCSNDHLDKGTKLLNEELLLPAGKYECKILRENKW